MDHKNIKFNHGEHIPDFMDNPADIFNHAYCIMKNEGISPYPFISQVNDTSHNILQVSWGGGNKKTFFGLVK